MSQVLQEATWNMSNHQQYFTSIYFILLQFTTCNEPASSHFLLPNNVWRYPWFSTFLHIPSSIRYFHTLAHIWKDSVTKNIFIDMFHDSNMRRRMFKVVETNRMLTTCQCQWKHNYININKFQVGSSLSQNLSLSFQINWRFKIAFYNDTFIL